MTTTTGPDTLDLHAPFPVEWNAWRAQWTAYLAARTLPASSHRFDGVNFLTDEVLGTYDTPTGPAELSEVTFPDLTEKRRGRRVRYVGVTLATGAEALDKAGGIVRTFAELDRMIYDGAGPLYCIECGDEHEDNAYTDPCDRHADCIVSTRCGSMIVQHTQPEAEEVAP